MPKRAVLMLNLGSPDSTKVEDVREYLGEFLMDERVLDAPKPIRWMVVNGAILPFRAKASAEAYENVWMDEGAPLIVYSERVRDQLREHFDFPVEIAMRYRKPSVPDALAKFKADGIEELFIFPMYPHYAMSSYETAVVQVYEEMHKLDFQANTRLVQPYYQDDDYIEALAASAEPFLKDPEAWDMLLFSFHGIPVRHLEKSDPSGAHCQKTPDCCNVCNPAHATCYRHQCLTTVRRFVDRMGIPEEKYTVSFQSRLGKDPWLTPYTDQELERLAEEGVKNIRVMCPAFVADCLETIEEISMEGKAEFLEAGGESFEQIPCLNDHPAWIEVLRKRIQGWIDGAAAPPAIRDPLVETYHFKAEAASPTSG